MYERLLHMASRTLSEFRHDSPMLWEEPYKQAASAWRPCVQINTIKNTKVMLQKSRGFIMVSANGGLNQQRVVVCNAVAVAVAVALLLNATLVSPKFLYSSVWKDTSQFGDIYQEEYFMNVLLDDINIVKELLSHLQSLNMEAIGSLVTPLLMKNEVVHSLALLVLYWLEELESMMPEAVCWINNCSGNTSLVFPSDLITLKGSLSNFLALHLRFEMDMVAYSLCDFGGGENERKELQGIPGNPFFCACHENERYKIIFSAKLRKLGRCPLTPEEVALMLSAIRWKRDTYIYLAGSHMYGEQWRMLPLTGLYRNLVTKENLLTASELAPFKNFSSQLAALDFIACATAEVFVMTDSGSQLSSLVTVYRTYYGAGRAPTLRSNKKRFANILSEKTLINWHEFKGRVTKMIEENRRVQMRRLVRSIYRQPRCPECMCMVS